MEPSRIDHFSLSSWINGTTAQWQNEAAAKREIRYLIDSVETNKGELSPEDPELITDISIESESDSESDINLSIEEKDNDPISAAGRAFRDNMSKLDDHRKNYLNDAHMKAENSGWNFVATQLKGEVGSRIVNLLLLPTELIDSIYHLAMSILTPFLAAGESFVNLFKDPENETDYFTMMGATDHLENAFIHAGSTPIRFAAGVLSPAWADEFTTEEVMQIRDANEARIRIRSGLIKAKVPEDQLESATDAALFALDLEGIKQKHTSLLEEKAELTKKIGTVPKKLKEISDHKTQTIDLRSEKIRKQHNLIDKEEKTIEEISMLANLNEQLSQTKELFDGLIIEIDELETKIKNKTLTRQERLIKIECELIELKNLQDKAKEINSKKNFLQDGKKALAVAIAQGEPTKSEEPDQRNPGEMAIKIETDTEIEAHASPSAQNPLPPKQPSNYGTTYTKQTVDSTRVIIDLDEENSSEEASKSGHETESKIQVYYSDEDESGGEPSDLTNIGSPQDNQAFGSQEDNDALEDFLADTNTPPVVDKPKKQPTLEQLRKLHTGQTFDGYDVN